MRYPPRDRQEIVDGCSCEGRGIVSTEWPSEIQHLPVDQRRGIPIPYVAERVDGVVNFGILDQERSVECYQKRLCAMCGLRMGSEVALFGDVVSLEADGFYVEPPVHERCIEIALGGLCPYISSEAYPRRRMDDPDVMVLGARDELREVGRSIAKRPSIVAIACNYQMYLAPDDEGRPMPVYVASVVERVRHFAWVDGKATEVDSAPVRQTIRIQRRLGYLSRSKRRR